MTSLAVPNKYDVDYMNKICGECGKYSPKGLNLDLNEPEKVRKWKCNKCFYKR